uniref:SAP domain-containing protein n=1 Tax=Astyanax mexicanus TaxID=7994 RepID=A0A3B1KH18_ASTMX
LLLQLLKLHTGRNKKSVAELKMELKLRGLPVSGTKTDLIERLKPYQDTSNSIMHHLHHGRRSARHP